MSAPHPSRTPGQFRWRSSFVGIRLAAASAGLLLLAACGALPSAPLAGADPSNPSAPSASGAYRTVTGTAASARPVDAGEWREQNERIAPGEKP